MSEQPDIAGIPEWDLADRMRKALRHAGVGPGAMAEYLGVGGNTVSTWINGRIRPDRRTIRLWALRTGVSYDWLCHGTDVPCFGSGTGVSAGQGKVITGTYSLPSPFSATPAQFLPLAA